MATSNFSRMTPAQKESYIARMMPVFRALKKNVQTEIRDYILKSTKLFKQYAHIFQ